MRIVTDAEGYKYEYFEEYERGEITDKLDAIGTYTKDAKILDTELEGKNIKVSQKVCGLMIGVEFTSYEDRSVEYKYHIGDHNGILKFNHSIRWSNEEGQLVDAKKVYGEKGVMLEKDKLVNLSQKDDLSSNDVLTLIYNLNARANMPESLRDFKTFPDLKVKIEKAPEDLQKNILSLMTLIEGAENSDCIKTVLYDLRNTDDKKFNINVRDAIRNSMAKLPRKNKEKFAPLAKSKYLGFNPTKEFLNLKSGGRK